MTQVQKNAYKRSKTQHQVFVNTQATHAARTMPTGMNVSHQTSALKGIG
jgi:hypothetical protein